MNTEYARQQMVEQQVRTWDVLDPEVLATLAALPREDFVPTMFRNLAYADGEIPLGHGQFMLRPVIEGRMLQALNLTADDEVLEIGTGSGYLSACLASLTASVTSLEIHEDLAQQAEKNLHNSAIDNVSVQVTDAFAGLPDRQYNAILLSGSTPILQEDFIRSLVPGGRMFAVLGHSPSKNAVLVECGAEGEWSTQSLFETDIPELVNAPRVPPFSF